DRESGRLRVFAQSGFSGGYLSGFGDGPAEVAHLESHVPGAMTTEEVPEDQLPALAEDGIDGTQMRSLKVTLPGANGRVLGQLCLHVREDRQPSQRDMAALRLMALQAATLAERYTLEEHSDEMQRRMEEN